MKAKAENLSTNGFLKVLRCPKLFGVDGTHGIHGFMARIDKELNH